MALGGAQPPEPNHRGERRLLDQAVFLGNLARSARAGKQVGCPGETQSKESNKAARFGQFLEAEVEEDEEELTGVAPAEESGAPSEAETNPLAAQEVKDDQVENRKDADRQSRRGLEDEAEKAVAGSWRGPHLVNPSLALLNVPQQLQAQQIEKKGRTQGQRDAGDSEKLDESVQRVSDVLLQALRQGGLAMPLTGLSDPRLKGAPPLLGPEWKEQTLAGGGRVFRWESSTTNRQVLRWSERESLLETTAAGQRQVIQKVGDQIWSETTAWSGDIGFDLPKDFRPF